MYIVASCLAIVGCVVAVAYGDALSGFDVHEGDGVVHMPVDALAARRAEMADAQPLPVDAEFLLAFLVLKSRDVYAIDAVGGIGEALAAIVSGFPFTCLQCRVEPRLIAETFSVSGFPAAAVCATTVIAESAVTVGAPTAVHVASVPVGAVVADAVAEGVGIEASP